MPFEHRRDDAPHHAAGELEVQAQVHLAGVLAQRRESPFAAQAAKRAVDQSHADLARRLVLVERGELALDAAVGDLHRCLHRIGFLGPHARAGAPRQKARVALDVGDEAEHLGIAVGNEHGALDAVHGRNG
jgi:hypothetical protein